VYLGLGLVMIGMASQVQADTLLPNDPTLAGDLLLWYSADDVTDDALGSEPVFGTDVATWYDGSGQGNDALDNKGAAFRPTVGALPGVYRTVRFGGNSGDRLDTLDVLGGSAVGDVTIIAVYRTVNTGEWARPVGFGSNDVDGGGAIHINLAPDPSLRFDGANISTGYTQSHPTDLFVRTMTRSGDAFAEYFNGVSALPATMQSTGLIVDDFFMGDLIQSGSSDTHLMEVAVYDRALTTTERQSVESHLLNKIANPVDVRGYWRFENGTADTADSGAAGNVFDASGHGNDGTAMLATGGTATSLPTYRSDVADPIVNVNGRSNSLSLQFDRSPLGHYVEVADDSSLDFGNSSFTLEAYVKLNALSGGGFGTRQYVMMKKVIGASDGAMDYALLAQMADLGGGGNSIGLAFGQNSENIVSSLQITDTDWHYLAASFDAAKDLVRFVLDDQFEYVAIGSGIFGNINAGPLILGGHFNASSILDSRFDGLIDEARVSAGVLDLDQLLAVVPIPEPTSLSLLVISGGLLIRRHA
jgi:hypothetical protein